MYVLLGWISVVLVIIGTAGTAYFFKKAGDEDIAKTEAHRLADVVDLQNQLAVARIAARDAAAQAAEARQFQAQRHLSDSQQKALIDLLRPFAGQKVIVRSIVGNGESKVYRDDWIAVFKAANWDYLSEYGESVFVTEPIGVTIYLHPHGTGEGSTKPGGAALVKAIETLKLFDGGQLLQSQEVADDQIMIALGNRERPNTDQVKLPQP
jgi:hypothetical protein